MVGILGLKSDTNVDGNAGEVLSFNYAKGRWQVKFFSIKIHCLASHTQSSFSSISQDVMKLIKVDSLRVLVG